MTGNITVFMCLSSQKVDLSLTVYISNPGGIQYHLIVYPRIDVAIEVAKDSFTGKYRLIKLGFIIWFIFISQNNRHCRIVIINKES